jgi:cell division septation protein DedD
MVESRKERLQKAAARRMARDFSPGPAQPPPASGDKSNRKFFAVAAGAVILALVAFICGVQMGKALSDLRGSEETGPRIQDRKGEAPPFRFMEKGKMSRPIQEARPRSPETGESRKEPSASQTPQKAPADKAPGPSRDSSPPPPEEEKAGPSEAKYTLQVGAFKNPQEALELVNQLKKKGYDAYQVTGSAAAKGTVHRVRIGHFQSLQEAKQFALTFEKKENLKPIISSLQNP